MADNRPTPIIREVKEQGIAQSLPVKKLWTFGNANETKDKQNESIDFHHIFIESDDDGFINGYEVEVTGEIDGTSITEMVNILLNKRIGAIFEVGSGVSYPEYSPTLAVGPTMFSKGLIETTIMEAATSTPMVFSANTLYMLLPR